VEKRRGFSQFRISRIMVKAMEKTGTPARGESVE